MYATRHCRLLILRKTTMKVTRNLMRNAVKCALSMTIAVLWSITAAADDGMPMRNCMPQRGGELTASLRTPRKIADRNPYVGERRQLVVLVSFSDQQFSADDPLAEWDPIFNAENYHEAPFVGSISDYFRDQSYGQFKVVFDLMRVSLSESRVKYRSTAYSDENSKYLVRDILDALQGEHIDWSHYDWNGDGYVDQIIILYAGKGQNSGGDRYTIWPHCAYMSSYIDSEPCKVTSNGMEYLVDTYCCIQELTSANDYGVFGTICHEYSHCFGLPDFYYSSSSVVGSWDLMDYGNNNGNGFCPANYSAAERLFMGWMTPVELNEPATVVKMAALGDEPEAYIVRNDGYPNEYYMVENRQQKGWDQKLPGSGLLVFHIDYSEHEWIYGMPNQTYHRHYTIIPANNLNFVPYNYGWAYPFKDNNLLTNTSLPVAELWHKNTDETMLMSKPITEMAVDADGLGSFLFMGGAPSAVGSVASGARPGRPLYEFGRICIGRDADGNVRKWMKR